MAKHPKPEDIVAKLRQADVLISQGQSVSDAIRVIGVSSVTYCRWRREFGGLKSDQVRMTMMAYAFLQSRRLTAAGRKKRSGAHRLSPRCRRSGRPSSTTSAGHRRADVHTVTPPSICRPDTNLPK